MSDGPAIRPQDGPLLRVANLTLAFRRYAGLFRRERLPILHGVDLDVAAGEMVAVFGESGAGKSLLAHAVLGILPGNTECGGTIAYAGQALTPTRQAALRGRGIALVPQSVGFLDPLARAGTQVRWAARRAGIERKAAHLHATDRLAHHGLRGSAATLFPHMLSGGMARRVLLAIATVGDAPLVIADEPTNGLDPEQLGIVLSTLRRLADRGRAVLVITHDIAAAVRFADRVVVLRDGRTVDALPTAAFHAGALPHPYTRALWAALPSQGFGAASALEAA